MLDVSISYSISLTMAKIVVASCRRFYEKGL